MDNAIQRENFTFGGRRFTLAITPDGEYFSVELIELADKEPWTPTVCYATEFLEQIEAEIEFERVLDDVAAFV